MSFGHLRRVAAVFASAMVGLVGQSTVVVRGGGPALNLAIQQATPGDHLIVRAADYDALLVDRGLRIECDVGVRFDANAILGSGSRIFGVPAGQWLSIRGGVMAAGSISRLEIHRCTGVVTWVAPTFEAAGLRGTISIENSASVSIESPVFPAVSALGNGWLFSVTGSATAVSACTNCAPFDLHQSSVSLDGVSVPSTYGIGSLLADASHLSITGGSLPGSNFNLGQISLPGIRMTNSDATITGGARITAGTGQTGLQGAIEGDNSLLRLDPSVQLVAPGTAVRGTIGVDPRTVPQLELPRRITSAAAFDMWTHGAAQDVVFVLFDLPGPTLATPLGSLWITTSAPILDLVAIPAGSTATVRHYTAPSLPAALPLVFQAIRIGASGEMTLGTPSRVFVN